MLKKLESKIGYIHAVRGAFVAFIIFVILAFFLPTGTDVEEMKIILTISTFLFAIIAGFFFSRLNARYDLMRELITTEDYELLKIYRYAGRVSSTFQKAMVNHIDKYLMVSYDFEIFDSDKAFELNEKYYKKMWSEVEKNKSKKNDVMNGVMDALLDLKKTRNRTTEIVAERMTLGQWLIMLILVFIIMLCIFYIKELTLYSVLVTVLLATALVLVTLMLRDLQNLKLGGRYIMVDEGQDVFETIGKKPYFHIDHFKSSSKEIKKKYKVFRVGIHKQGDSKTNVKLYK